jgi:hypothetical protein
MTASPGSPLSAEPSAPPAVITERQRVRRIRFWLVFFVCGLVVAGLTAFPLEWETRMVADWLQGPGAGFAHRFPAAS